MGLFDRKSKNDNNDDRKANLSNITSGKAGEVIKKLSGKGSGFTKKLPDNIVTFSGAAGGTGVSTIVANMAYTASKKGLKVLVIDLNLLLPAQNLYFGIKQELEKEDLVGYLLGKNNLGAAISQSQYASVTFANNRGLMDYINCETDQAIHNFKAAIDGLRSLFDLIIIDCPMNIENSICNHAFYLADHIYLVWDEGISCIANTERIRRNMAATGIDAYTKMKVILNKRTSIQYSKYPFEKLNVELVGMLPFEQDIIQSSLYSEIFCEKASSGKNSAYFCGAMDQLTLTIMKNGGYIE